MKRFSAIIILLFASVYLGCTAPSGEKVYDNPLDKKGTNYNSGTNSSRFGTARYGTAKYN